MDPLLIRVYEKDQLVFRGEFQAAIVGYETALAAFESRQFRVAARALGRLVVEYPGDGPSLVLLSRAVNCLVDEPTGFDGTLMQLAEK
jgi:hypothetical protein